VKKVIYVVTLVLLITGCQQPKAPIEHLPPRITPQDVTSNEVKNGLIREDFGLLYSKCHYLKGLKEGECRYFSADTLDRVEQYHQGKLEGERVGYYPDGTISSRSRYSNGHLNYDATFNPNGQMLKEEFYRDGEHFPYKAYEYDQDGNKTEIPMLRYRPPVDPWFRNETPKKSKRD
jgi:hypothetical protein